MSQAKVQAEGLVQKHVLWSMGMGAIPIPFLDTVAVSAIQLDMLKQISNLYGYELTENIGKSIISVLAGGTLVRMGASALKTIPILGSIIGGGAMVILSGASTYAIGSVFIQHFEKGGNLFDIDTEKFKNFYKEKFEQGKEYAQKAKEQAEKGFGKGKVDFSDTKMKEDPNFNETDDRNVQKDTFDKKESESQKKSNYKDAPSKVDEQAVRLAKIQELQDLKDKGILTEEEFERMKEKI